MERSVTFRFYRIGRHKDKDPTLVEALREISKIKKKGDRERQVSADFVLRLEEFENSGSDAVVGEIIRIQSTNMPCEVSDDGRAVLSTENPLGHSVVFLFNHKRSVLCIQHEPRIASAGRLLDYVTTCLPDARFKIDPMLKPRSWERFNSGAVRKLAIRIVRPEDLGDVAGAHEAAASGLKRMGEAYEAPSIRLELSMGGSRKGALAEAVKGLAKGIVDAASMSDASVESLRAVTYIDDAREEIDLIEERLKVTETLPLDDRDPVKNYKIKKAFAEQAFSREMSSLK